MCVYSYPLDIPPPPRYTATPLVLPPAASGPKRGLHTIHTAHTYAHVHTPVCKSSLQTRTVYVAIRCTVYSVQCIL